MPLRQANATLAHSDRNAADGETESTFHLTASVPGNEALAIRGRPGPVDIVPFGTPGDDNDPGTPGNDTLTGDAGNDTLSGGLGNDSLSGGDDNDNLSGGEGNDSLYGDSGLDSLFGGNGNDQLRGGTGNDTINGDVGNDYITGEAGNDSIVGGDGNDTADYFFADQISAVQVNLATGVVTGGGGNDTLVGIENANGTDFNDSITGSTAINFLEGRGGNDTIRGGDGEDYLRGGLGNDLLDGQGNINGASYDYIDYRDITSGPVVANLATGVITGAGGNDTAVGCEGAFGTAFGDSFTGRDDSNDVFFAGGGNDTVDGAGGFDLIGYIFAGAAVTVDLAAGTSSGADGNDQLSNFEGILGSNHSDDLTGNGGDNFIRGYTGNDVIDGGDGNDRAAYDRSSGAVNVSLVSNTSTGADGNDTLISIEFLRGGAFNDTLTGDDFINNLEGRDGNDLINAGAGRDSLFGEGGNDTLNGGEVLDRVNYSDGNFASWGGATSGVILNSQTGVVQDGRGGVDQISNITFFFASDQADSVTGSTALIFEQFEGGLGNDTIDGGVITDTLNFDNGNRVNYQSAAAAVTVKLALGTATGGAGNDQFSNINQIRGSGFDDVLTGSDEDVITETFEGRAGDDTIDGAGGNDQVRYQDAATGANVNLALGTASDGDGGTDTISNIEAVRGSSWNDTLIGGNAANGTGEIDGLEVFEGRAGDDSIDGAGGYDRADYQNSLAAVNVTLGGAANGTASDGEGGTDTLISIEGVRGSPFADTLTGSDDAAQFESFEGREGNDTMDGNGGTDRADYTRSRAAVVVNLATGTASDGYGDTDSLQDIEDVLGSRDFADSITGSTAANWLEGQGGNDTLNGGDGADTLVGGNGNDRLDGGLLNDSMAGGAGNDSYVVNNAGDVISEASSSGSDSVSASVTCVLSANIEKLTLTGTASINGSGNGNANTITGNSGNNTLSGSTGNDTLSGGNGNDSLNGGSGNDSMSGGAGNDSYSVDAVGDVVVEAAGGGTDTVNSTITYTLGAEFERLVLGGTAAINGSGNTVANTLTGNGANNALSGGAGNDTLSGGNGNDTLTGGSGNDSMSGGAGNDNYSVDAVADIVVEAAGGGIDNVNSTVTYTLPVEVERLVLGGTNAINGTGNAAANTLTGNGANNALNGSTGNDTLSGGNGNDTLSGGSGNDSMTGGAGNDNYSVDAAADIVVEAAGGGTDNVNSTVSYTLGAELERLVLGGTNAINGTGNAAANTLTGNSANNTLNGGSANDTLSGGGGNDSLIGGTGNDSVSGGAGLDVFRFGSALNAITNVDTLTDFNVTDDRIELENSIFTQLTATGVLSASNFRANNTGSATDGNDHVLYETDTGQLFYDADGNGAVAKVLIANLTGLPVLTSADFFVT